MSEFAREQGRGRGDGGQHNSSRPIEQGLLQSFKSLDLKQWNQLFASPGAKSLFAEPQSHCLNQLLSTVGNLDKMRSDVSRLQLLSAMLSGLLDTEARSDKELGILVQNCIIRLQRDASQDAVELAHKALQCSVRLKRETILCTISTGVQFAHTPGDLTNVLSLTQIALDKRQLGVDDPKTISTFNVILAATCDPHLPAPGRGSRIGPRYRTERSLRDVADRLVAGAGFAEALAKGGMRFTSPKTENRMNLAVMALIQIGAAVALEGRALSNELTTAQRRAHTDTLSISVTYPIPRDLSDLGDDWHGTAKKLLTEAVQVARYSFALAQDEDETLEVRCCNIVRGKTIARLIATLDSGLLTLEADEAEQLADEVAALLFCALSVPDCHNDIPSSCVYSALRLVNTANCSPKSRADRMHYILHFGLSKVRDSHLLSKLPKVFEEAAKEEPELAEHYEPIVERIDGRIDELATMNRSGAQNSAQASKQPGSVGGGWFSNLIRESHKKTDQDSV